MSDIRQYAEYLSEKLQLEIKDHGDAVARGACADFGEYKYQAGIIRGLMIANGILQDAMQSMEQDEDE